jgi:hypothetical protein
VAPGYRGSGLFKLEGDSRNDEVAVNEPSRTAKVAKIRKGL